MFENIFLEPEQKNLFCTLVEAARNVSEREKRDFFLIKSVNGEFIRHAGLPENNMKVFFGDIEELLNRELISVYSDSSKSAWRFRVTSIGFQYYGHLKQEQSQPFHAIEDTITTYLNSDAFQKNCPEAYKKWTEASSMLWGTHAEEQLTQIGHLCREATQEFATALVNRFNPPNVSGDKAQTVNRLKGVIAQHKDKLGQTESPFLDALIVYWGELSDLIQRQEHGGQREKEPLIWEDARRVVFHAAVVMFEIDKALREN